MEIEWYFLEYIKKRERKKDVMLTYIIFLCYFLGMTSAFDLVFCVLMLFEKNFSFSVYSVKKQFKFNYRQSGCLYTISNFHIEFHYY